MPATGAERSGTMRRVLPLTRREIAVALVALIAVAACLALIFLPKADSNASCVKKPSVKFVFQHFQ